MRVAVIIISFLFIISGCAHQGPNQQTGTGVGAVGGAIAGAAIGAGSGGGPWRILTGAAIGAVAGGLVGTVVGKYMDDQETALRNAMATSTAQNTAYVQRANEQTLIAVFKSDLMFDSGSAIIKPGGLTELDRVSNVLNQYPNTTVRIEGHTDNVGSEQSNMVLSQNRANSVKNVLIQKGINSNRISAIGFGEGYPISSNQAQNRRVNIVITGNQ